MIDGRDSDADSLHIDAESDIQDGREFHDGRWVRWTRHYKDIIEVISIPIIVIIGGISLLYMHFQMQQLSDSDTVITTQTSLLAKQVEAIWYNNRPILRIRPTDPKKDITEFIYHDTAAFHVLHVTVENVGPTPAIIRSVHTQVVYDVGSFADTTTFMDLMLSPTDRQSMELAAPLLLDRENYLKMVVTYSWDRADAPEEKFLVPKYFKIYHRDAMWHIYKLDAEKFNEVAKQHLD